MAAVVLIYGFFLSHTINLITADLGRHLENGKIFFETGKIITTNFYSYTNPDFHTLNHHWLSGVLFFLVWKLAGFKGLQLFFTALSIATFLIFFRMAQKHAGMGIAGLLALSAIPLLAERTEIRPEVFSYFFAGLIWYLAIQYKKGMLSRRMLFFTATAMQILWVNAHIFFFMSIAIIGTFFVESILRKSQRQNLKTWSLLLIILSAASLINPSGIEGALAPLNIFNNYGYKLAENQSILFMEKLIFDPNFIIFKIVFGILALSFVGRLLKKDWEAFVSSEFFLAVGVSLMAWLQIRNLAMFGFFAMPLISNNISLLSKKRLGTYLNELIFPGAGAVIMAFLLVVSTDIPKYFPSWHEFGFGLEQNNSTSAEFFKNNNLSGPIFNNYDIGGYLIWNIFPKERVFVDNRPEAYPASFFTDTYIPAQENYQAWKSLDAKYNFNVIFFSYKDLTPWGQHFMIERLRDQEWAPVFADGYVIIFLRRNSANKPTIESYEIPQSAFSVSR